ncbi:MAG: DUF3540 domain-containing protein, partial [Deltaproteobacteria bacterium]|nr:DUF3540 domain-containing protein [Deltaproteobacteria bacterium]
YYLIQELEDESLVYRAQLAPSCLLEPRKGDGVLAFVDAREVFILAILQRDQNKKAQIALPKESVLAAQNLTISAPALSLKAQSAQIHSDRLLTQGHLLRVDFQVGQFLVGLVSSICRSLLTTTKNFALRVSGQAQVSSQNLLVKADRELQTRSGGLDLKASGSIRLDGRDIKLG